MTTGATKTMPFLLTTQQCQSTERKMYQRSTDLFTTSSPRRFPTLPLTTKGSWLPCYRPMPVSYHCPKEMRHYSFCFCHCHYLGPFCNLRYRCQSVFNEYLSRVVTECRSWYQLLLPLVWLSKVDKIFLVLAGHTAIIAALR